MQTLVIVESPAKAGTIKKYLGKDYNVMASKGHIRDLPKKRLGIDPDNDFQIDYIMLPEKRELITQLKQEVAKSDRVLLATDPDREGEAISWHLAKILNLNPEDQIRVTFSEITKSGVEKGMANPRCIDLDLVDAQQARRVLDRLVGYKLSPFLWSTVKSGLSAGRVQSVAVRMIVDREEEIRRFKPEEYWTIEASVLKDKKAGKPFDIKLHSYHGKKVEIKNEQQARDILSQLDGKSFSVLKVTKRDRQKGAQPPFITSTLQQEASKRLNFVAKKTMSEAQKLYEGVFTKKYGNIGLITYMRTDSQRISEEAVSAARDFIAKTYGKDYLPAKAKDYSKNKNNVQDAHEAIRPTTIEYTPEMAKEDLDSSAYRLYKLIWERFMASQMAPCIQNTVSVDIGAGDYLFRSSGYTVAFDGFTKIYADNSEDEEGKKALPELAEGEALAVEQILPSQHFTVPPARYTEASLIKELEENGIGRPSTYAPTISTIQNKNYVEKEQKFLKPTAAGEVTTKVLKEHFPNIVDVSFTADMEKALDDVESEKTNWKQYMKEFYGPFSDELKVASEDMKGKKVKIPVEETDEVCELCGKKLVVRVGRNGKFLGCSGFPSCTFTKPILVKTSGECPTCHKMVVQKKSKRGRIYYCCEDYPKCTFITWDVPLAEKCPRCQSTLFRVNNRTKLIHCLKDGCGYEQPGNKKDDD